jgi:hypothetical protein
MYICRIGVRERSPAVKSLSLYLFSASQQNRISPQRALLLEVTMQAIRIHHGDAITYQAKQAQELSESGKTCRKLISTVPRDFYLLETTYKCERSCVYV